MFCSRSTWKNPIRSAHQESSAEKSSEGLTSEIPSEKTTADPEIQNLYDRLKDLITDEVTAKAFYSVGTELPMCEEAPISSIIENFQHNQQNVEAEADEGDDDSLQVVIVSAQEARSALATSKKIWGTARN
ncbi:hypothetical protein PoB_005144100 [Plakobranchus ocellatus]|uniref:Uncharacterized protein n=1 Tax=Plakobranchus ocellatus TaxID=259542 RepID=A0AAV4BWP0_9GAST|nr:hypothetical protein PoB_005144100 [Plakobranchus ocellatus]